MDFADNEDIIKLCNTLLQAYSRRISWIGDQANGENKIESRLDDMEKVVRNNAILVDYYNRRNWVFDVVSGLSPHYHRIAHCILFFFSKTEKSLLHCNRLPFRTYLIAGPISVENGTNGHWVIATN